MPPSFEKQKNAWTKEWEIFVDGTAYYGQICSEEEKDGLGKEISILGTLKIGLFEEGQFVEGLVINQNGEYYFFNLKHHVNIKMGVEDSENCHTDYFYFNDNNYYKGRLKNGIPHGLGHFFFDEDNTRIYNCDMISVNFEKGEPHGLAKMYQIINQSGD